MELELGRFIYGKNNGQAVQCFIESTLELELGHLLHATKGTLYANRFIESTLELELICEVKSFIVSTLELELALWQFRKDPWNLLTFH